ncbi:MULTISPECIES: helix-turn-helix transcriptional regulator [Sutcliffiella]|uniref:HTH cro/C1-type domain-containing protein n=1 Tax=Sutcliffiella cohnii TaxID=33932 RepID=A0A223KLT5_9BACI|nr:MULTISPECIES: helix-turn-helix transcriptional regulator [Sutcliffiella]AST90338.1 hypothetical protein BC6307_03155 [Sutcliffiella cohnii]MED4017560.1 helix-turn-helix transcriptional regulator [Sutcliffiella cohnii]WBL15990.1 helix-turn-helix transcriptional regulator [Sutcliffiella sp. NC1]
MTVEQRIHIMDVGSKIKFFRLRRNFTQEELAQGIISVSYLSKIENNITTPSLEVLKLLSERLEVDLFEQENESLLQQMFNWYYSVRDGNAEQSRILFQKLEPLITTQSLKTYIYFSLFKARYFILLRKFDEVELELSNLEQYQATFDLKMTYFYYKFQSIIFYIKNNFHDSIEKLKEAEKALHHSTDLDQTEKADIYYLLGLAYSQLMRVPISIIYTKESLLIYQSTYNYTRSAECQILLGISYRRIGEYDKAEESYILAWKIAELSNNQVLQATICHNLGKLFSDQKQHEKALVQFQKSYKLKENVSVLSKLNTIFSIVDEYYQLGDLEHSFNWLELGRTLLEEKEEYKKYSISFHLMNYLLTKEYEQLDTYFLEIALPYYRKHHMKELILKFSERLALHFEQCFKYKKASYYYSLCYKEIK